MPAPSLLQMATRACIRNVQHIQDVGDMQYDLVKPILRKVENPQQLQDIETNSPAIADSTENLWREFIKRDIPNWEEKIIIPKNPRSWCKVYRKLIREEQRAKDEIEARLQAAMADLEKKRGAGKTTFEPTVIAKLPGGKKAFVDGNPTSSWRGSGRGPSQATKSGQDIIRGLRKRAVNPPGASHRAYVPSVRSQIKHAPAAMVRDHAKPPPPVEVKSKGAPISKPKPLPPLSSSTTNTNLDRENRLRAFTSSASKSAASTSPPSVTNKRDQNARSWSPSDDEELTTKADRVPSAKKLAPKMRITKEVVRRAPTPVQPKPNATSPSRTEGHLTQTSTSAESPQTVSPAPALPTLVKKRPVTSIFMPSKKRKI